MTKDDPHRLILVRHGLTEWNITRRYQGTSDIPLCSEGEEQARLLGLRLKNVRIDRVYSSPLSRARRTAEIAVGGDIIADDDLRELSFGTWEGRTIDEIEKFDAMRRKKWMEAPFEDLPEGAESMESMMERTRRAALMLRDVGAPGETTAVFAHAVIIRALFVTLIKADGMPLMWRMGIENCAISVVKCWGEHSVLSLLNDTSHMKAAEEIIPHIPL